VEGAVQQLILDEALAPENAFVDARCEQTRL
jgi:hypothetical protein